MAGARRVGREPVKVVGGEGRSGKAGDEGAGHEPDHLIDAPQGGARVQRGIVRARANGKPCA